ncbi:transglutaminase-like domain-containing protein [Abyssisolibacter fermentans]|uniref:transglutaminase-like domain-containing protein n=1 Tax=Abyssisolibacter fermentans TaxID=1766203 RepID=UPI00138F29F8|nr:transglutaminase-like domain-containing protein [Abyssisolibacter fermentans]
MFKKIIFIVLTILLTFSLSYADDNYFDLSEVNKGLLKVNFENTENKKIKIMVQKDNKKSFYDLKAPSQYPLNFGNGEYVVAILENTTENKYKSVSAKKINVNIANPTQVYLNQSQMLNWNENTEAIKKAKNLTKELTTNKEKAIAIHDYIVKNFKYDNDKINSIENSYTPNSETTFKSKSGICSDFASLYAVMLRSVNVPTKYVKGNKNDIDTYHAWNQVYLEDSNKWVTVDITYDNTLFNNKTDYSFEKDSSEYTINSEY